MLKTEFTLSLSLEERELYLEKVMEKFSNILDNKPVKNKQQTTHWLIPSKWNDLYEKASFEEKNKKLHIIFLASEVQQTRMLAYLSALTDVKKIPLNILQR